MFHLFKLFTYELVKCWGVLILGLFSVIYFTENGAVEEQLQKYEYLIIVCMSLVFIERLIYFIRYKKYIQLPYALSFYNRANNEEKDSKIFLDKFIKYNKRTQTIYFKNRLSINKEAYLKLKEQIIHLLGYADNKEIEFEIKAHNKKEIIIRLYKLSKKFNWSIDFLRDKNIYLGHSKDGACFLPLSNMTSTICCGESGAGKSNFLNMVIFSLLHNIKYIEHLNFIDLKGVELSCYKLNHTTFTDSIEETDKCLEELKNEMNNRFKQMKETGDLIFKGKYRICLIDEIGSIGTHHNKKLREQIFNNLIELGQKGRASKVLLFIFSQKIDSTNIPTNVLTNLQGSFLFKTSSQFNINNCIGLQEEIEEITRNRVQDFPKGRMIFKDGLTSDKILMQTPFLSQEVQYSMIKYFREYINK